MVSLDDVVSAANLEAVTATSDGTVNVTGVM